MNARVIDASAVAAVLFDEPEAAPVLAMARGRLLAPSLLRYELASVCATKLRQFPDRAPDIEGRYALVSELSLELVEPEWNTLPRLALRWSLSAYDAAYLQLALQARVPLITLDRRLAETYDRII